MIGGFFVVNLFLAVVFDEFMRSKAAEAAKAELCEQEAAFRAAADAEATWNAEARTPALDRSSSGYERLLDEGRGENGGGESGGGGGGDAQGGLHCLRPLVTSRPFLYVTLGLLVVNVVLMCMPYAGQSAAYARVLHLGAAGLASLFVLEIFLRLLGLGCAEFMADGWNQLDLVLALFTLLDLSIVVLDELGMAGGSVGFELNLTAFRALRLLRVLRLLRLVQYWKGVYKIFSALVAARGQVVNIFILLFVFMTCFSLVGVQLFGGKCGASEGSRYHFDYFVPAMLTVLIVFSGGWFDPLSACADGGGLMVTRLYFLVALLIGFFVIMNLFVSIILEALADFVEEQEEAEEEEEAAKEAEEATAGAEAKAKAKAEAAAAGGAADNSDDDDDDDTEDAASLHPLRAFCRALIRRPETEVGLVVLIGASSVTLALDSPTVEPASDLGVALLVANYVFTLVFALEACARFLAYDPLDPRRGYLTSAFNLLDLVIVVISLISLCPEMEKVAFLRLLRVARPLRLLGKAPGMQIIFVFLSKASGDVLNVGGVVFFCHTLFAVVGMELFLDGFGQCTDESIPLRALCYQGPMPPSPPPVPDGSGPQFMMKPAGLVVRQGRMAMAAARPVAAEVAAHAAAAAGMGLMTGRRLKGGGGGDGEDEDLPVAWLNPNFGSFDNFGSAVLLLFIAATGDGWDEHMFAGMDSQGSGVAEVRNDSSPMALFFILWLVIGSFTMMNLFVGSVVDNFTRIKAEEEGSALMTQEQRQWVRTMQEASAHRAKLAPSVLPPTPPAGGARRAFFVLVNSQTFDLAMTSVIVLNTLLMAVEYHRIQDDAQVYRVYRALMQLFTDIYYVEATLKLLGLGCGGYFQSNWNRFDFFLVVVSLLDQFASELLVRILPVPPMLLRVIRIARIMRILRLLKRYKRLRDLIKTTVLSFPSFLNVGSLLGLVTFIYAVLGVQLFYAVGPGDELNRQRNFANFGSAALLLVQCLTGDGWSTLMMDTMAGPERGCDPDAVPTDCGSSAALPYFLSYMVVGSFILLNLIVAVILENFSALGDVNPDLISAADITDFGELWAQSWQDKQAWMKPPKPQSGGAEPSGAAGGALALVSASPCCPKAPYTPSGRPKKRPPRMLEIDEPSLAKLLLLQPPPLGLEGRTDVVGSAHVVASLSLSWSEDGFAQFQDVVNALVRRSFEGHLEDFGDGALPVPVVAQAASGGAPETPQAIAAPPSRVDSPEPALKEPHDAKRLPQPAGSSTRSTELRRAQATTDPTAATADLQLPVPVPLPPPEKPRRAYAGGKPGPAVRTAHLPPPAPEPVLPPPSTPSPLSRSQSGPQPDAAREEPRISVSTPRAASFDSSPRVPASPAAREMAQALVASKLSHRTQSPPQSPAGSNRPARPVASNGMPQPVITSSAPSPIHAALERPTTLPPPGGEAPRSSGSKTVPELDSYRHNAVPRPRASGGGSTTRTGARRPEPSARAPAGTSISEQGGLREGGRLPMRARRPGDRADQRLPQPEVLPPPQRQEVEGAASNVSQTL